MKLCFIAPFPPPCGGITNWTKIVYKQLEKDESIHTACLNISPSVSFEKRKSKFSHIARSLLELHEHKKRLKKIIREDRPDVIHLTTSGGRSFVRDFFLLNFIKKSGIPCVYHLHFGKAEEFLNGNSWKKILFEKNLQMASTILAIDQKTYDFLKIQLPKKRIEYIPNPVEMPEVELVEPQKKILFLGWVINTKGVEELLQAWESVKREFPEYTLEVVGAYNDEYKQYLESSYSTERVVFTGEVTHEAAMQKMNECSLFVLPSYTEGFPNVILEAMILKKPIIATSVGAIPEMLDGGCGIVVNPRSADPLKNALSEVLNAPRLMSQMGENAYAKAHEHYQVSVVLNKYISLWEKMGDKS